ncbi:MAG: hypothetical protein ACYTAN_17555, partial [Planctomycetota bacterium]
MQTLRTVPRMLLILLLLALPAAGEVEVVNLAETVPDRRIVAFDVDGNYAALQHSPRQGEIPATLELTNLETGEKSVIAEAFEGPFAIGGGHLAWFNDLAAEGDGQGAVHIYDVEAGTTSALSAARVRSLDVTGKWLAYERAFSAPEGEGSDIVLCDVTSEFRRDLSKSGRRKGDLHTGPVISGDLVLWARKDFWTRESTLVCRNVVTRKEFKIPIGWDPAAYCLSGRHIVYSYLTGTTMYVRTFGSRRGEEIKRAGVPLAGPCIERRLVAWLSEGRTAGTGQARGARQRVVQLKAWDKYARVRSLGHAPADEAADVRISDGKVYVSLSKWTPAAQAGSVQTAAPVPSDEDVSSDTVTSPEGRGESGQRWLEEVRKEMEAETVRLRKEHFEEMMVPWANHHEELLDICEAMCRYQMDLEVQIERLPKRRFVSVFGGVPEGLLERFADDSPPVFSPYVRREDYDGVWTDGQYRPQNDGGKVYYISVIEPVRGLSKVRVTFCEVRGIVAASGATYTLTKDANGKWTVHMPSAWWVSRNCLPLLAPSAAAEKGAAGFARNALFERDRHRT